MDDDHLQLQPVPACARRKRDKGRSVKSIDEAVATSALALMSGLRQYRAPEPSPVEADAERCDLCQRPSRRTTGTCSTSTSARSSVCARAAGAAVGRRRVSAPTGNRTLWLEDFRLPEEIWAQARSRSLAFFMYSSVTDCVVALYPSPAGATGVGAPLRDVEPARRDEPGAEGARARRRGADRQPDGDPAYAIAPIDRGCYMLVGLVKSAWEGISGGAAVEQAIVERYRGAAGGRRREPAGDARGPRRARARVPGARRDGGGAIAAVPALDFDVHVSEPGGRSVYAIALSAQIMIEPAAAATTPRRARSWSSCSARRSAGPPPRAAWSGTRPTCSCRPSRARRPSAWRSP